MFDSLVNTLLVVAALYVYLSLYRQVATRHGGAASLGEKQVGLPEAIVAALLIGWFSLNIAAASNADDHQVVGAAILFEDFDGHAPDRAGHAGAVEQPFLDVHRCGGERAAGG